MLYGGMLLYCDVVAFISALPLRHVVRVDAAGPGGPGGAGGAGGAGGWSVVVVVRDGRWWWVVGGGWSLVVGDGCRGLWLVWFCVVFGGWCVNGVWWVVGWWLLVAHGYVAKLRCCPVVYCCGVVTVACSHCIMSYGVML